jgi:cytochrome c556
MTGEAGLLDFPHIMCSSSKGADDMRSLVKTRLVKLGLVTFCALASVSAVHAQDAPAGDEAMAKAVENRQAVFKVINWSFDPVAGMLKNKVPFDAAVAAKAASRIEAIGPMITEAFAVDTRKATGVKTKAREGIWTNAADFKAKNDDLVKAAAGLSAAAKGGDKKAVLQAAAAVGKACGACHDSFRDK